MLIVSEDSPRPNISSIYVRRRDTIHSGLPILDAQSGCEATCNGKRILSLSNRTYGTCLYPRRYYVFHGLPRLDFASLDSIADC